ncbi:MAG: DNA-binding transcriptional regulator Fis [Pseudohongiella sp.]|jgi:Fis family transcriptional regulator, factor for inversion stimulation protein|nr:DNA-binding transcriptional regulator Fis [Pseudohongiella sp.]
MNKFGAITDRVSNDHIESLAEPAALSSVPQEHTLRSEVEKSLSRYFLNIENELVTDLHQLVMSEVEAPLLRAVMRHTGNNQSKASIMLGLNRGTLRTKLKQYGLL